MRRMTTPDFLAIVERYLVEANIAPSRFGIEVLSDPSFVKDLRAGRKPNLDSVNKVLDHIERTGSPVTQPEQVPA